MDKPWTYPPGTIPDSHSLGSIVICAYCCIMENLTFTPNHSLRQSPIKAKVILGYEHQAPDFDNIYYNR